MYIEILAGLLWLGAICLTYALDKEKSRRRRIERELSNQVSRATRMQAEQPCDRTYWRGAEVAYLGALAIVRAGGE